MLVDIQNLGVRYSGHPPVVEGFSLGLQNAERVGLAGESGCGKTTILRALVGLLPSTAVMAGKIRIDGRTAYIPQEGLNSLSPFLTAGTQVTELTRSREETARLFARVGLGDQRSQNAYPHQLSGGERQRVLAIQAVAMRPAAIIADEPVANLDPESESAVLSLMDEYARESGAAILVASHSEHVFQFLRCRVHRMTPEVGEISAPDLVESAVFHSLLSIRDLSKTYFHRDWLTRSRPVKRALDGVSLEIGVGEAVAIVGPSGAGKSTLARCLAGRERWDSGSVEWQTDDVPAPERVQLVQQEPSESLNPAMTIAAALREACGERHRRPWAPHSEQKPLPRPSVAARFSEESDAESLAEIRLPPSWIGRKVTELSEGQRARVGILRSAARLKQGLLILDESLSSLDKATRSHIVSYLSEARKQRSLSVLLVTHDHEVAAELGTRMVRMESGRIAA